ncbi:MAG: type IV pili methyl-accepting chemotaxis transducer N-terminal domain-containing protein, partial [Reinekea sp.]|nr:type IV pili methyl-accepting chemotaxis transducer N-terminal domain-containing protein [Reinekea sp.]
MLKITRYPIAISLTLGLILVALLSILASLYSIWMTTVLSGDASAVNVSGSLRMQSYRIAFAISQDAPTTDRQALLAEFEQRLTSPQLKGHIPSTEPELNQLFSRIESHFLTMKDNALNQPTTYLNDVAAFVADIDRLVASLEKWSEGKVKRLRQQQVVINGLTLFAASLFTLIIFFRVVSPLQALMRTVVNISQGDRSARANYDRADEFGELTTTFNQMADEIADVHNSLESTIHEQTQELSRNNQILEFLFNLSQALSIERPDI